MSRVKNLVKNPNKYSVKNNTEGTFTFSSYPYNAAYGEYIITGRYDDCRKVALEHFKATNSTNYMTIQLMSYSESEISNSIKIKDFEKEIKKLKKLFK